jgi:1-acyl-sn-glycerol-3-phosphate acyltransferase
MVSPLYRLVGILSTPVVKGLYRLRVQGLEHLPEGGFVLAANHTSNFDPWPLGVSLLPDRKLRFMAKAELFEGRSARLLSNLGAFPVKRGTADPEALQTARSVLRDGGVLALFPEGTRHRDPDALRAPRRGAGRLAIEEQAPVVPCAISGTEKLFVGILPRPVRVQVSFAAPISPSQLEATPEAAADLIENHVWPEVERQFHALRARQGLIAAGVAALAAGGGFALRAQQQKKPKRRLPLPRRFKKKRRGRFR